MTKGLACSGCGAPNARRRLCSGGAALCAVCRGSPEHRVVSEAWLGKAAPWLPPAKYPEPVGSVVNCRHPAFKRQRMYAWGDVALRCLELAVPIP